jgi:ubiquinol-cytochrome c reductase cytochrome b subunit
LWDIINSVFVSGDVLEQAFIITSSLSAGVKGSKYSSVRKVNPVKAKVQLTQLQIDVLVGTILGDATIERVKINHSPRLRFEQSFPMHAAYLTNLYIIFMNLVGNHPIVTTRKPDTRTGSNYSTIRFSTLSFPCFTYYFDLFYFENHKVVPSNIVNLLTPRALAYWIMDDGGKGSNGEIILHTRSFTFADVQRLQDALAMNFNLRTRLIEKTPNQWVIVIPIKQTQPLKYIVSSYICQSMLYKL